MATPTTEVYMPPVPFPSPAIVHGRNAPAVPAAFGCTLRDSGGEAVWVRVTGELDIATASELEQTLRLAATRETRVVLDLRELTFMDTCGAHVIVDAGIRARQAGQRLVLVRGPAPVDRMFTLMMRADVLEIVDLHPAEPPVQALLELVKDAPPASSHPLSRVGR